MMRLARENNLNSLEQVRQHFRLVDQEFELGVVLTPTMKIRRQQARIVYEDLINEIYKDSATID
jgi:long-subunit acyl-CoA synthetase (AMP-forming)